MAIYTDELGPVGAPSVVLLHGLGTTGWMWRPQATALAADLHVLVPDLPGHGRSNGIPWRSLTGTAELVAGVIRTRTETARAHVVGLSLGGYVATRLAADVPELVESAIVSGVNVLPFPHPTFMRIAGLVMAPFMTVGPALRANARTLRVPPDDVEGYVTAARSTTRRTFSRAGAEVLTFRVPAAAGSSPSRLLAVAGEREHHLIIRSVPELAAAFRHGSARLAPGVGHAWNGEAPALFTSMVRAHVANAPLPHELTPASGTTVT